MGYVLIAVMFYTLVKYGFEIWLQLFYAKQANERDYGFGRRIMELEEKVTRLGEEISKLETAH